MSKVIKIFVILILLAVNFAFAQDYSEELILEVPEIKTFKVNMPTKVAISNPEVADVSRAAEQEVVVSAKSAGKTTLVIWDKTGQKAYSIRVISSGLNDIKLRIDKLLSETDYPNTYAKLSNEEDKVLLLGSVDTEEEKKRLDSILGGVKEKIIDLVEVKPYSQLVQIDVEILEISKNALEDLGFNWTSTVGASAKSALKWTEENAVTNTLYQPFELSRIWTRGAVSAQLDLILSQGKGRLLARPKLVCLSGKEAKFLVGGEVPILSSVVSGGGASVNVEYKNYGVSLNIKPEVKPGGFIQAMLKTEVSEIDSANAVTASGINAVAFLKRSAETELYLKENQTVFLAGLIKNKEASNYNKLPALGEIPILGMLFRSRDFTKGETELVISLTPRIITQSPDRFAKDKLAALNQKSPKTLLNYISDIQDRISKAVVYPEIARRNNLQGEIMLSLHILADGRLLNILVNKSSGDKILDDVSLNIVKSQAPFAPIPASSGLSEIWIDVPIVFKSN